MRRSWRQLLKQTKALVIDVSNEPKRPAGMAPDAPWLPLPQEVIPGSAWLPGAGMGDIAAGHGRLLSRVPVAERPAAISIILS